MSDVSEAETSLFVPRADNAATHGRWLSIIVRLQDALLFVWLAHVSFVPQQFSSLVNFVGLAGLWVFMLLVGTWHLVKVPARRGLAAWGMVAFPLAFLAITLLEKATDLPVVGPPAGSLSFYAALSVFPLYWLARWLLRTTSPQLENPVRMHMTAVVLLVIVITQMSLSLFLVWVLSTGNDFLSFKSAFGNDWYADLLKGTLGTTLFVAIGAVPYAVLGFLRGSGHRGAMLGILFCVGVAITCSLGVLGYIAMMSFG